MLIGFTINICYLTSSAHLFSTLHSCRIYPAAISELSHSLQVPKPTFTILDLPLAFLHSKAISQFGCLHFRMLSSLFTHYFLPLYLRNGCWSALLGLNPSPVLILYPIPLLWLCSICSSLFLHIASFQLTFTVKATLAQLLPQTITSSPSFYHLYM